MNPKREPGNEVFFGAERHGNRLEKRFPPKRLLPEHRREGLSIVSIKDVTRNEIDSWQSTAFCRVEDSEREAVQKKTRGVLYYWAVTPEPPP